MAQARQRAKPRKGAWERRMTFWGIMFALPWLLGFVFFNLYPIIASFYFSFTEYHITTPPEWVGLQNYKRLFFEDDLFRVSLYNTFYYLAFAVPIGFVLALFLAVLLNQKLPEISIYKTIVYVPCIVPQYALAIIFIWFFHPYYGIVNAILDYFGIKGPGWFADPAWAKFTIVIAAQWGAGASAMIFLAALNDVPEELYEAADLDGASWWHKFFHITIPMICPVILYHLITAIIGGLQMFTLAYIATGGGPGNSTLFYLLYLYRQAFSYMNMGYASAMAWILFVIAIFLSFIVFKSSGTWVYYHGVK